MFKTLVYTSLRLWKRSDVILLLLVIPFFVSCVIGQQDDEQEAEIVRVGDRMPAFAVVTADGLHVTTDSLLGHRSVVVFFHTECGDCRKELPQIDILYRAHRHERDFRLICIARDERQASIQAFWDEKNLAMPYSPQPDNRVYSLFARRVIPRIYMASPDGIVRFIHDDHQMPSAELMEEELKSLYHAH